MKNTDAISINITEITDEGALNAVSIVINDDIDIELSEEQAAYIATHLEQLLQDRAHTRASKAYADVINLRERQALSRTRNSVQKAYAELRESEDNGYEL